MTRINANINPAILADEHLIAEHREIKRVPAMYKKCKDFNDIPKTFTLGTGHVKFFYDKPIITLSRYMDIYAECIKRNLDVTYYKNNWNAYDNIFNSVPYTFSKNDNILIIDRIISNIEKSNKSIYHKNHKIITKEEYINFLLEYKSTLL